MVIFTYFLVLFVSVLCIVVSHDGYENSKLFELNKHRVNNRKKQILKDDPTYTENYDRVVMCSIWNWTSLEHSHKFDYTMFDGSLCTHLVYSICSFNNDGRLLCGHNQRNIPPIMSIKDMFPHLLVLVELSFNLETQHHLIKNEESRRKVLQTGVDLMREFQFDGICLHVNLPMIMTNHSDHQMISSNFYKLVKDLASKLWKYKYWIVLRLKNYNRQVLRTYDIRSVTEYVDFFSVYMLDTGGIFKPYFPLRGINEHDEFCLDYQLRIIRSLGIPMSKILVVILIGDRHMYPDYESVKYEPPQPGVTKLIEDSEEQSVSMLCKDLYREDYQWVYVWDSAAHVWFTYRSGSTDAEEWAHIIAYETPRSIIQKVRFAMKLGVRGFYVSHANWDDVDGTCPTTFSYHEIYQDVKKDFNELRHNKHVQSAIPLLELPDDLTTDTVHIQWPIIYLKNRTNLSLGLPLRANTSYSSLKSIHDGITFHQQEALIMDVVSPSTAKSPPHDRIVMCGIQNWLRFMKMHELNYENFDATICTHLVYRSVTFNEKLELTNVLENHDEAIPPLVDMRHQYPHLQLLLEISLEVDSLHHLIMDSLTRHKIIETAITFLKEYNFDGISLFLTLPSKKEDHSYVHDRDMLYNFIKDLSSELWKDDLHTLHLRVMNYNKEILLAYEIKRLIEFVDYFSLYMSDTAGVFKTWFPLKGVNKEDNFSLDYQIRCLMRMGIPMKIGLIVVVFGGRMLLPALHEDFVIGETVLRRPPQFKTVHAISGIITQGIPRAKAMCQVDEKNTCVEYLKFPPLNMATVFCSYPVMKRETHGLYQILNSIRGCGSIIQNLARDTFMKTSYCQKVCTLLNQQPESWEYQWDNVGHVGYSYRRGKNHSGYYADILAYESPRTLIHKIRFLMQYNVRGFVLPNINWDDSEGVCPSSFVYRDNYKDLKNDFSDLQNNYDVASIVETVKLPKHDEIDLQNLQYPQYTISNGVLSLVTPIHQSTNFSSLRAVQDGIMISKQEHIILEALEGRPPKILVHKDTHAKRKHQRHTKYISNRKLRRYEKQHHNDKKVLRYF